MKSALVVGSGAGGATVARDLQGRFQVTVLEAGREFRPLGGSLAAYDLIKRAGLMFDEREISLIFPAMKTMKTRDGMVLVRGMGTGGTTTLAVGNALRMDADLKALGVDLDEEFDAIAREVPITSNHRPKWRDATHRLYRACGEMGLSPVPIPKMGRQEKCRGCGRCVLGCPYGVKWDGRELLKTAIAAGAEVKTGHKAERVVIRGGEAGGVEVAAGRRRLVLEADVVILAAGGLGTPVVLERSGIPARPKLFVDPVLCVAGPWKNALQNRELSMPFAVQMDRYILSPYFDHLSYYFNREWRPPAEDILSLMIKLADSNRGSISTGSLDKPLTDDDRARLRGAVERAAEILGRLGIPRDRLFFGTLNAGHPGGMVPLGPESARSFHDPSLPENLYVADACLFPDSLGNPPILTIMAMARRVSKLVAAKFGGR
jgi:choline dehydrogenase-like flavoprotein